MQPQAVVFDMDGVLIDSEPVWRDSTISTLLELNIEFNEKELYTMTGFPALKVASIVLKKYPHLTIKTNELADLINKNGVDSVIKSKPLFPNVSNILEYLYNKGIKIAIASASPLYMLQNIVDSCNISKYFSAISSAMNLDYNKPHPDVYLQALKMLKIDNPENTFGIEDSFVGMIAVKAANMNCIAIPSIKDQQDPRWSLADYKLTNILQLKEIIK